MKMSVIHLVLLAAVVFAANIKGTEAGSIVCYNNRSKCYLKSVQCPAECPNTSPSGSNRKVCTLLCNVRRCETRCRKIKPDCNGVGAACKDPRFIGADGTVFYFHGQKNEHFALVSDPNLQINARFIGLRPEGRARDFTWIQALGMLFDSHSFSIEAIKATTWDEEIDHLKFAYDGKDIIVLSEGNVTTWESNKGGIKLERNSGKNSATITIPQVVEISVNAVPVTKEDDKIHNYHIPSDDCFAHLEVQFRFYELSLQVEGVLGRTYQPEYVNPAKIGVEMPVLGGEGKYRTSSLLSANCNSCIFASAAGAVAMEGEFVELDCTGRSSSGSGILCRK